MKNKNQIDVNDQKEESKSNDMDKGIEKLLLYQFTAPYSEF